MNGFEKIDVQNCPRCGGSHKDLVFSRRPETARVENDTPFFAFCPKTHLRINADIEIELVDLPPEPSQEVLVQEHPGDSDSRWDWVLKDDSCWIRVEDLVVYIRQNAGGVIVEISPKGLANEVIDSATADWDWKEAKKYLFA